MLVTLFTSSDSEIYLKANLIVKNESKQFYRSLTGTINSHSILQAFHTCHSRPDETSLFQKILKVPHVLFTFAYFCPCLVLCFSEKKSNLLSCPRIYQDSVKFEK